jgi:hypothetical protein
MQRMDEIILPVHQTDDSTFALSQPELMAMLLDIHAGTVFFAISPYGGRPEIGTPGTLEGVLKNRLHRRMVGYDSLAQEKSVLRHE